MEHRTRGTTQARLPYHAPQLREHGTVQELTLANTNTIEEFDGAGYAPSSTPSTS